MPLRVPKLLGPSEETGQEVRNRWATMATVRQRLEMRGIVIQEEPPPFPIPEITTTLVFSDHQEYLRVNGQYLAWLAYLMPHLALCKGYLLESRNEMNHLEMLFKHDARVMAEGTRKKMSSAEIDENIQLDPRYVELKQLEQEMTEERELLESKIDILKDGMKVISRHVEMKKIDVEQNRTAANLPRRPHFTRSGGS